MSKQNYYETLGVGPQASLTEIKRAYRKLARLYHPDSGTADSSNELFQEITVAYECLSNPEKRLAYDLRYGFHAAEQKQQSDAAHERQRAYRAQEPRPFPKSNARAGGFAGPNSARFRGESSVERPAPEQPPRQAKLFGKLGSFLRPFVQAGPKDNGAPKTTKKTGSADTSDLRGPREYYFTVDARESIRGTSRELALPQEDGTPRVIRVKIPAGIRDGGTLKVQIAEGEYVRIVVTVTPHPYVSRNGDDIVIRIPITVSEGINGLELDVPTPEGAVRVKIPPKSRQEKKLRLKGRGIKNPQTRSAGDLYVETYIVLPETMGPAGKQAAEAIDAHYLGSVRHDMPREL